MSQTLSENAPSGVGRDGVTTQLESIRVLLFERNPSDALVLREHLAATRQIAVDVTHVDAVDDILTQLRAHEWGAILLGLDKLDGQGLEVLNAVQAAAPKIPVIVLAAQDDGTSAIKALQAGAQDYLVKGEVSSSLLERSILHSIERKRAEEALRRSQVRYEQLVNSIDGVVWEADANTVEFLFISKQAERLLGYPTERWLKEPTFWQDHMHPADRDWAPGFCAVATREKRDHEFEYRMIAADGRLVWLRDIVTVVIEDDQPVKLRGVMIDITKQKEAEEESRRSEERFRALFDQAPSPIRVFSPDGHTIQVNRAWSEFSGMTLDQLDKRSILDEEWHVKAGTMPYLRRAFSGETTEFPLVSYAPTSEYTDTVGRAPRKYWMKASAYAVKDSDGAVQEVVMVSQDVTEQKEAEEALRISEERFRALFEQSPFAIHTYSPTGETLQVNQAWCDLYGVTPEYVAGYNILEDEKLPYSNAQAEVLKAFAGEATELPMIQVASYGPDGSMHERYVKGFAYPVKDHEGSVREVVFTVQDITRQKEAEESLKEKEEQYRSIFEATTDGLVINDMEGNAVEVNAAFCEMHGYSREEILGMDMNKLHPANSQPVFWEYLDTIKDGQAFMIQGRHVHERKDGTHFYVEVQGTTFNYKGKPHILGVVRDVTARVEAEERQKEAEQQYRRVFEATGDGLVINDLDGKVVEVNPAFCEMHGYTYEEMLQLTPFDFIHPDYHHMFRDYSETLRSGGVWQGRAMDVRKDGTPFHVEVHGSRFIYNGKPHVLGVVRDITERVQAYELLEQRVEERTRELSTLLEVSHNVASTLELRPLLGRTLEQLKLVTDYSQAAIAVMEGDVLTTLESRLASGETSVAMGWRFSMDTFGEASQILKRGEPVIVHDVRGEDIFARTYRDVIADLMQITSSEVSALLETRLSYLRSWVAVPLMLKENLIGLLTFAHNEPGYYEPHHAGLAMAVANQAAIAIENARLYEQAQERAQELSTLLEVSNNVASTLDLEPLLGKILEELKLVADNSSASIVVKVGDGLKMFDTRSTPVPEELKESGESPLERMGIIWEALSHGETIIIPDVRGDTPIALAMQEAAGPLLDTVFADMRSWLAVPLSLKDQVIGLLSISHTEPHFYSDRHANLAMAIANQAAVAIENARLYEQAHEASRVTGALAQIASRVAFGGSLDTMLHDLCAHVVGATGAVAASVALRNEDSQEILMVGGHGLPEGYAAAFNTVLTSGVNLLAQEAVEERRPVVVRDMREKLLNMPSYAPLHKYMDQVSWDTVVAVPMLYHDQVTGILFSYHPPTRNIEDGEITFHTAIADQAIVAIENARLYEQAQQTTSMTAALAQIASRVAFGGSLEDMLDDLCQHVVKATGAMGSIVTLFDPASKATRIAGTHGLPEGYAEAMDHVLSSGVQTLTNMAASSHQPVVLGDIRRIILSSPDYAPLHRFMHDVKWDTIVAVPMLYSDTPLGVLLSYHPPTRKIEEAELALHTAIANQAAVAVQNALLLTEVQGKAALEERQKLARELHDSVSQAIFSISLQARTAQTLLQRDPTRVEEPLRHITSLSQAAMAEMRALIFELRPESLESEGLITALNKQASALSARHSIQVEAQLCDEPPISLEQKQAVYRIAQEALHNTIKHARASQVNINLQCDEQSLTLEVADNGSGFDPSGNFPGHLGLKSMRERAARLGGTLQIESSRGQGTSLRLAMPMNPQAKQT